MDTWGALLAVLITGLGGLLLVVLTGFRELVATWFRRMLLRMRETSYFGRISCMARFLFLFEQIRKLPEVQRCVIFQGHNCGGMPTIGKDYMIRALEGWSIKSDKPNPEEAFYYHIKVDAHYTLILQEVMAKGAVDKLTADMPEDSKLRYHYEHEELKFSRIYMLGLVDCELLFLSVGSYEQECFDRKTVVELQLIVDEMRELVVANGVYS